MKIKKVISINLVNSNLSVYKLGQIENKLKIKSVNIKPISKYLELEHDLPKSSMSLLRNKTDSLTHYAYGYIPNTFYYFMPASSEDSCTCYKINSVYKFNTKFREEDSDKSVLQFRKVESREEIEHRRKNINYKIKNLENEMAKKMEYKKLDREIMALSLSTIPKKDIEFNIEKIERFIKNRVIVNYKDLFYLLSKDIYNISNKDSSEEFSKDLLNISFKDSSEEIFKDSCEEISKDLSNNDSSKEISKDLSNKDSCEEISKDLSNKDSCEEISKDLSNKDSCEEISKDLSFKDLSKELSDNIKLILQRLTFYYKGRYVLKNKFYDKYLQDVRNKILKTFEDTDRIIKLECDSVDYKTIIDELCVKKDDGYYLKGYYEDLVIDYKNSGLINNLRNKLIFSLQDIKNISGLEMEDVFKFVSENNLVEIRNNFYCIEISREIEEIIGLLDKVNIKKSEINELVTMKGLNVEEFFKILEKFYVLKRATWMRI